MSGNGHVRASDCGDWELGMDCTFDERSFYFITAGLWLFTCLPLTAKAFLPRGKAPTGAAKWCLLSTAASSACMAVDALLYVLSGPRGRATRAHNSVINNHAFMAIGSIFLCFGLRWFGRLWCTILGALGSHATHTVRSMNDIVKVTFDSVAFLNVPVALVFAVCGTEVGLSVTGLSWDDGVKMWMSWCFLSACLTFTFNSVLMLIVVQRCLSKESTEPKVGRISLVTKINLAEQLFYDLCLGLAGLLYLQPVYNAKGMVQATVYALTILPAWMMHAQVLVFFAVTTPDDPLYSEKQLHDLLLERTWTRPRSRSSSETNLSETDAVEGIVVSSTLETGLTEPLPAGWTAHVCYFNSTTGQSQWEKPRSAHEALVQKPSAPKPSTIGSPELEAAQARPMEDFFIEIPPPHDENID